MPSFKVACCFLIALITASSQHYLYHKKHENLINTSDSLSYSSDDYDEEYIAASSQENENYIGLPFYFQKPVIRNGDDLIFVLITRAMNKLFINSGYISSITNQIYILMALNKQKDVDELLISIFSFLKTLRDCAVKESLDRATIDLLLQPQSSIQEVMSRLECFLSITNNRLTPDERSDLFFLKKKILHRFPWFSIITKESLAENRDIIYSGMQSSIQSFGYKIADFEHFMNFLEDLLILSTYIRFICYKIPGLFIHSLFAPWSIFNALKDPAYRSFSLFLLCLELVFYLFEVGFIPDPVIQYNRAGKINHRGVCGVVQFIGVLFYIQEREKTAKSYYLSLNELQLYIDQAFSIANLPDNEEIIMKNYYLLCQKLENIKAYPVEVKAVNRIIGQYIYCNVALFCGAKPFCTDL